MKNNNSITGTFTTAIALSTFAYLMMENQELQKDLLEEATSELRSRTPSGEDRKKMPLMEATILEILRYISHVPLNLPHCTLENTTIGGYDVPKDTQVYRNLMAGMSQIIANFRGYLRSPSPKAKNHVISFQPATKFYSANWRELVEWG